VGLITCPQQNQIAHAASPPTLGKNSRIDWIRAKTRFEPVVLI
jgi:hypothetical protein